LRSPRQLSRPRRVWILHLLPTAERGGGGEGPLARDPHLALVEAALLAAEEPLAARRLAEIAGLKDAGEARRLVRRLQSLLQQEDSSLGVMELAGGYQLLTKPEYHSWLARWRTTNPDWHLSPAARETLAIVAYRQPVMRADIETIRGVQCGDVLRVLMEKGFVRIVGRHASLGRPVLYGTTRKFLQVIGLNSLEDLPQAEKFRKAMTHVPGKTG
jgi:segregation and condensation protein B